MPALCKFHFMILRVPVAVTEMEDRAVTPTHTRMANSKMANSLGRFHGTTDLLVFTRTSATLL